MNAYEHFWFLQHVGLFYLSDRIDTTKFKTFPVWPPILNIIYAV